DKRVSAPADDYVLRVRLHKSSELYPRDMKVGEAGFRVGETVDIMFTDPNTNEIIGSDNVMECK
ncbi:MAG: hypothetical protein L3J46_08340, partial [Kangiellaceae bacterium]|nr:hypothetical protein [Kangiellaceae bacterium]